MFFAKSCILDVWHGPECALDSLLLTSDHAPTSEPHWLKKTLLDWLKDQVVVTIINGTPDVVTFLETVSRILQNFGEDKVSRNALLLLTFNRIILIFPCVLKSYPYLPVYVQNHRFYQYLGKYWSEKNFIFAYFTYCLSWF